MNKNILFFLLFLSFIINFGYSQNTDSLKNNFQAGIIGGFSQNEFVTFDVLGGRKFNTFSKLVEANIGYSYSQNLTNYNSVKNILYFSHWLFAEGNYFLN